MEGGEDFEFHFKKCTYGLFQRRYVTVPCTIRPLNCMPLPITVYSCPIMVTNHIISIKIQALVRLCVCLWCVFVCVWWSYLARKVSFFICKL